ncbi:MAG: hypothetical protein Q9187_003280 [Circinaria calcarea]
MAYQSLVTYTRSSHSDSSGSRGSTSPPPPHPPLALQPVSSGNGFPDRGSSQERASNNSSPGDQLDSMINTLISSVRTYHMVGNDDSEAFGDLDGQSPHAATHSIEQTDLQPRPSDEQLNSVRMPQPSYQNTMVRTVSREGSMRHPTPDLQSLQGAYIGNIERLERSAERLSMSSDIGEGLRKIRDEQKRSESRKSSIAARTESSVHRSAVSRQFSSSSSASNSIMGVNSIARSGGFSPIAYMTSPIGSLRSPSRSHNSTRERSTSRGDRLMTQVSEPEKEGRPLDSPILVRSVPVVQPPKPPTHTLRIMNEDQGVSSPLNTLELHSESAVPPHTQFGQTPDLEDMPERTATSASTDTYRQVTDLFADFDGVHITTHRQPSSTVPTAHSRQVSLTLPPSADRPQSYANASEDNVVYYPAPVPMMLNLPKRLSKLPAIQRDKRRSEMLEALSYDASNSAAWLPDAVDQPNADVDACLASKPSGRIDHRQSMANVPPQLRASMFFEHPSIPYDIEVKGQSAVATLDSILDASAFAPVSAFTDHPIAGHLGANVYSRPSPWKNMVGPSHEQAVHRQSRSSLHLLKKRYSSNALLQTAKLRDTSFQSADEVIGTRQSSAPHFESGVQLDDIETAQTKGERVSFAEREIERGHDGSERDSGNEEDFLDPREELIAGDNLGEDEQFGDEDLYSGPPTTLLAELQLRKQQQKQRNRTAATAFPQGMHSTLLQLDAVAQIEKQTRKQRHIKLAWEDPDVIHPGVENQDDEDVPLGMLFPGRKVQAKNPAEPYDDDRPLGLIAKRAMEDNEPLSQRRARLKGEPLVRVPIAGRRVATNALEIPGLTTTTVDADASREGETLGQRLRRLKGTGITSKAQSTIDDLASGMMSQFGGPAKADDATESMTQVLEAEEETLGQRRKRLQAERQGKSRDVSGESIAAGRPPVKKRHSMADILQAHPVSEKRVTSQDNLAFISGGQAGSGAVGGLLQQNQELQAQSRQQLGGRHGVLKSPQSTLAAQRPSHMDHRASTGNVPMASGLGMPGSSTYQPGFNAVFSSTGGIPHPYNRALPYASPMASHNRSLGLNGYAAMVPNGSTMVQPLGQDVPVDTRHRDMVDRWRQSIRY